MPDIPDKPKPGDPGVVTPDATPKDGKAAKRPPKADPRRDLHARHGVRGDTTPRKMIVPGRGRGR